MEGNKWGNIVLNFVIRVILGMGLIYFINQYLLPGDNALNVGLNAVSFLTTGSLGIPGVCLLYGILFYQNL
ncbi:Pro-sigmaK processing inhibitor BofA [Hungatella hathewayi]|uniref:Pro-sigmaK processing inhibitor BofA n=1 Tax=Hungatella hathewayi TaxID=154046 RepID=A0A3E2X3N5_9FIRM|nr:pro-sigmaK processing inhibitor BofA family protein [Hungatella hathewayi]RGC35509.1 Pro-sigmaK processing inhibitor BofA [Hungatella hathewayi]